MLIDENNSRNISIEILSKDRIGLVHDITSTISALDAQVIHYHGRCSPIIKAGRCPSAA